MSRVVCICWPSKSRDKFCDNHPPLVGRLPWSKKVTDRGPILSVMPQYGDLLHSQMHCTVLANVLCIVGKMGSHRILVPALFWPNSEKKYNKLEKCSKVKKNLKKIMGRLKKAKMKLWAPRNSDNCSGKFWKILRKILG